MGVAIEVNNVSKTFKLPHEKQNSVKGLFVSLFRGQRSYERQQVLKDVSFQIQEGQFFGIVGKNGSGKSTLLKMLAGIYEPNQGAIHINGKLTPFIELGVGFNPNLTGRENVYLNGALLGFNRKEMDAMYDEIVDFAELHKFMDQKLKNYSSGMQVRLAFSIAIRAKSDILLLDEVLAVGDAAFQTKCFDYFHQLKKSNTTVIFVSHDRGALERFCDKGILIDKGEIVESGSMQKVLQRYSEVVLDELDAQSAKQKDSTEENIPKERQASIQNVRAKDSDGKATKRFAFGKSIELSFQVKFNQEVVNPIFGVTVWQKNTEKPIYAINTLMDGNKETGKFNKGDMANFSIKLPDLLNDGEYYVEPAVANESTTIFLDQIQKATTFFVVGSDSPSSLISSDYKISLKKA